jgi:hypothetical protein
MVSDTRTIGVTHTLGMPGKAHRLLINFGWREFRNITPFNLHTNITALDSIASNSAFLDFSKQRLVEMRTLGCTGRPSRGSCTISTASTTTTSTALMGGKLLQ